MSKETKDLVKKSDPMDGLVAFDRFDDLFDQFEGLFETFGDAFGSFFDDGWVTPPVTKKIFKRMQPRSTLPKGNIRETDTQYIAEFALAGFSKDDIHVELKDNVLFLQATKEDQQEEKGRYLMQEVSQRTFKRVIKFPEKINTNGVAAVFENGILTLTFEKEKVEVRKGSLTIDIN